MAEIDNQYKRPNLKPKQKIRLAFYIETETKKKQKIIVTVTVKKIYPHHVIVDNAGRTESYTYYDIWQKRKLANNRAA